MMKSFHSLIVLFCLCFTMGYAQKNTPMRAYNLYYEQDFEGAKHCIDQCVKDDKYKEKASTWLYKANIDYRIASDEYSKKQQDSNYAIVYPTTPTEAYQAFKKAEALNKNVAATDMLSPYEAIPRLYPILFIEGVNELIANRFENAKATLALAVESYEREKPEYPMQGELYYYYAYTLERLAEDSLAEVYYCKAIEDGSQNANVIIRLLESYKKRGAHDKMLSIIQQGKKINPNDPNIWVAEIDYYYFVNDKVQARTLLKNLPHSAFQIPETAINIANFYIRDSNYVEAETILRRVVQQFPNNYIINHNLGVCCDHIGNQKFMQANKLGLDGNKSEAEALKVEAEHDLQRAANYFEKALAIDANETTLLYKLKEIYLRLLQNDKAESIDKKIQSLN